VRSSGRMLQAEMSQDVVPCAFDASFPANHSVEAAEVPTPPTQDVLPKALPVALSLIKPASPFAQAAQSLGGRPKPRPRTDLVAEKIKTLGRAPDETLHAVKAQAERRDLFVQRRNGPSEFPAGAARKILSLCSSAAGSRWLDGGTGCGCRPNDPANTPSHRAPRPYC